MINDEPAPTGRPAGALGWAGLPNLFYWIDRQNGIGGFWATQVSPSPTRPRSAATWTSNPRFTATWRCRRRRDRSRRGWPIGSAPREHGGQYRRDRLEAR